MHRSSVLPLCFVALMVLIHAPLLATDGPPRPTVAEPGESVNAPQEPTPPTAPLVTFEVEAANATPVAGGVDEWTETRTTTIGCCGTQGRKAFQSRTCCITANGKSCSGWTTLATFCAGGCPN